MLKSSTGSAAVIEPTDRSTSSVATGGASVSSSRPRRPRGRPRIEGPERVFGHPLRLRIAKALAGSPTLSFVYLRNLLGTNDGTLAAHARKLENAGYVACDKTFAGRMPRTDFRLSDEGRSALEGYLSRQLPRR